MRCVKCKKLKDVEEFPIRKDGNGRTKTCFPCAEATKLYFSSEKGKAARWRANQSASAKISRKKYNRTDKAKAKNKKHQKTEKYKAAANRYWSSDKGKANTHRVNLSQKSKTVSYTHLTLPTICSV